MAPRILVTRRIPEEALSLLRAAGDVDVNPHDRAFTRDELLAAAAGRDGILALLHDRIDAAVLDRAPGLRVVANMAVGVDNLDLPACAARGVWVANTPDVLTDATAELAWALILACTRRIAEGDRYVRAGRFKGWGPLDFLGLELKGKTLGIFGAGRIGQAVGRKGRGFEMRLLYAARQRKAEFEAATGAAHRPLDALLAESDVVVVTVPLTAETRGAIGARELGLMKRGAYLVNVARGPVVHEAELARALREGRLAGAGLDVYEKEPEVHPDLLACETAVLLPHIGSSTVDTRRRMAVMAAENCLAGAQGRTPPQALNAAAVAALRKS